MRGWLQTLSEPVDNNSGDYKEFEEILDQSSMIQHWILRPEGSQKRVAL